MKNIFLLSVLLVAVLGCDLSRFGGAGNANDQNTNRPASPEQKPSVSVPKTPKPTPAAPSLIALLKRSVGKYPDEIKLLKNAELRGRLKSTMGKDFAAMDKYFNVQAPLEIEDGILMTTGCEAHNCGANQYLLFVDLNQDNINVYHLTDGDPERFFEKGEIDLPKKFADQIAPE